MPHFNFIEPQSRIGSGLHKRNGTDSALANTESMVELEKVASKIVLGNSSFRGESPGKRKL